MIQVRKMQRQHTASWVPRRAALVHVLNTRLPAHKENSRQADLQKKKKDQTWIGS